MFCEKSKRTSQKLKNCCRFYFIVIDFRHIDAPVDFEEIQVSGDNELDSIDNAITAVKRNGVALKGNLHTDNVGNLLAGKSHNVKLRYGISNCCLKGREGG